MTPYPIKRLLATASLISISSICSQAVDVANETQLAAEITAGTLLIELTTDITLTTQLPMINTAGITIQSKPGTFTSPDGHNIDGNSSGRGIFFINAGSSGSPVLIKDVDLINGHRIGGNGGEGAGGGMGAGGAIFVNDTGYVIAESVRFTGNRAVGGSSLSIGSTAGGGISLNGGGGGGGFHGNGGSPQYTNPGNNGSAGGGGGGFIGAGGRANAFDIAVSAQAGGGGGLTGNGGTPSNGGGPSNGSAIGGGGAGDDGIGSTGGGNGGTNGGSRAGTDGALNGGGGGGHISNPGNPGNGGNGGQFGGGGGAGTSNSPGSVGGIPGNGGEFGGGGGAAENDTAANLANGGNGGYGGGGGGGAFTANTSTGGNGGTGGFGAGGGGGASRAGVSAATGGSGGFGAGAGGDAVDANKGGGGGGLGAGGSVFVRTGGTYLPRGLTTSTSGSVIGGFGGAGGTAGGSPGVAGGNGQALGSGIFLSNGTGLIIDGSTVSTSIDINDDIASQGADTGITITGAGGSQDTTLSLNGNNSFTGPILVQNGGRLDTNSTTGIPAGPTITFDQGTFQNVGVTLNLPNSISVNAGGLDLRPNADLTLSGPITGVGDITQPGGGAVTLNNAASSFGSYIQNGGGITTVAQNIVADFDMNSSGLTNNAAITGDVTMNNAAVYSGAGTVSSNVTLNNTSNYTGSGNIGGNVVMNNSSTFPGSSPITGNLTLNDTSSFTGSGNVTGDVVLNNSSTYTHATSAANAQTIGGILDINDTATFTVELQNDGTVDLSNVAGAVTVAPGAILNIVTLGGPGTFSNGQTITFVDGATSVTGDFQTIAINGVPGANLFCFPISDQIVGDDLQLLIGTAMDFSDANGQCNNNASTVNTYLDSLQYPTGDAAVDAVIDQLRMNVAADLCSATDSISGGNTGDINGTSFSAISQATNVLGHHSNRLPETLPCSEGFSNIFLKSFGFFKLQDDTSSHVGYEAYGAGAIVGQDSCILSEFMYMTLALGYYHIHTDWNKSRGGVDTNSVFGSIGFTSYIQNLLIETSLLGGYANHDVARKITLSPGVTRTATHEHNAAYANVHTGIFYDIFLGMLKFTPFGFFDYGIIYDRSYLEEGAGAVSLDVEERNSTNIRTEVGGKLSTLSEYDTLSVTSSAKCSWVSFMPIGGNSIDAGFVGQTKFNASTRSETTNFISPGFEVVFLFENAMNIILSYDAEIDLKGKCLRHKAELTGGFHF